MREHFRMAVIDTCPAIYSCKCGFTRYDDDAGVSVAELNAHLFQENAKSTRDWTGPLADDLTADGASLRHPVPEVRWPYGPPSFHEHCCRLFGMNQPLYCDCKASDASDARYGRAP